MEVTSRENVREGVCVGRSGKKRMRKWKCGRKKEKGNGGKIERHAILEDLCVAII